MENYDGKASVTTWNYLYSSSGTSAVALNQKINGFDGGSNIPFSGATIFTGDYQLSNPSFAVQLNRSSDNSFLLASSFVPTQNGKFTAFVLGKDLATGTTQPAYLNFANRPAPALGKVNIRVLHAIPGASAVDTYLKVGTGTPSKIYFGTGYRSATSNNEVAAGSYTVIVTPGGVAPNNATNICQSPVSLSANKSYYLVVTRNSPSSTPVVQAIAER